MDPHVVPGISNWELLGRLALTLVLSGLIGLALRVVPDVDECSARSVEPRVRVTAPLRIGRSDRLRRARAHGLTAKRSQWNRYTSSLRVDTQDAA